ncbi:MAG: DEAD/DEAH box helicase [Polyangiaceae bacterium]
MTSFEDLGLPTYLLKAVKALGYDVPTPIQMQAIPLVTAGGDLVAEAETGSGKTAAFVLPILKKMNEGRGDTDLASVQVVTLVPTRELALQVSQVFKRLGQFSPTGVRVLAVIGGLAIEDQIAALEKGVTVVVATPGRLLDLIDRGVIDLEHVHTLVLDEADKLLDVGFTEELNTFLEGMPSRRQTLLFSATLPPEVVDLGERILRNHSLVRLAERHAPVANVTQRVFQVDRNRRRALLQLLIEQEGWAQTLVFVATQMASINLAQKLRHSGHAAVSLPGGLTQDDRIQALKRFKSGRAAILVATDIAARGIDIPQLAVAVNYDLPRSPHDYVHRIGRTGRAGASGIAVSFVDHETEAHFRVIEKKNHFRLERQQITGFELTEAPQEPRRGSPPKKGKRKSKKDKLRASQS